eukprot:571647-Pelagomonas_calceolata.AAC.5
MGGHWKSVRLGGQTSGRVYKPMQEAVLLHPCCSFPSVLCSGSWPTVTDKRKLKQGHFLAGSGFGTTF